MLCTEMNSLSKLTHRSHSEKEGLLRALERSTAQFLINALLKVRKSLKLVEPVRHRELHK